MRNAYGMAVCAMMVALPLSACSNFPGARIFARHHRPAAPQTAQIPASPLTDQGRAALDANMPGSAIEKFQTALAKGESMAPALNGMAVAYTRLGRFDLAQRFFSEAVAVDPLNEKYRANLAMLEQTQTFPIRQANDDSPPQSQGGVRTESPLPRPGGLQRVSQLEVRIVTVGAFAAPIERKARVMSELASPNISPSASANAGPDEAPPPPVQSRPSKKVVLVLSGYAQARPMMPPTAVPAGQEQKAGKAAILAIASSQP